MVEPREIVSSRAKTLPFLLIAIVFVAIALLLPPDKGSEQAWWWVTLVLFGSGTVVFTALLIRPQRLLLDREGFTIAGGLARSPRRVGWRDVDRFFVYRLPRGGRMIGYTLAPHARPGSWLGDLNRRVGADGLVPKTLPGSPETIAADLNAYRRAALDR